MSSIPISNTDTTLTKIPATTSNSFSCQQTLHISEISKTPKSLLKFPLVIIEPDYENPGGESTERVFTPERLDKLLDRYHVFRAKTRWATYAPAFQALGGNSVASGIERDTGANHPEGPSRNTWAVEKGKPMASDDWLVPRPYDPAFWFGQTEYRQGVVTKHGPGA